MIKRSFFSLLFFSLFIPISLQAQNQRFKSNDLVIEVKGPEASFIDFFKGTWNLKGNWQVSEGTGKVIYTSKARIYGTVTYTPILDGHFLQKEFNGKVTYISKELEKKLTKSFSYLNIMTYNKETSRFYAWTFDSGGCFMDAEGGYSDTQGSYIFTSHGEDCKGQQAQIKHKITIVDDDHYKWEVLEQSTTSSEWHVAASGISTRKK